MLRIVYAAIFTLVSVSTVAQNCNFKLTGKIEDFHNGEPIEGATIFIENLNKYATSDANGFYKFEDLCESSLKITVSHITCEPKTMVFEITQNTIQNFVLEHHVEELETVNVDVVNSNKQTSLLQESVIKKNQIDDQSAGSLGDVIDQIGGVSKITTGSKIVKPVINGLHSSRVVIVNNDVRMEDQEWGIEHAPNIDVNAANSISVIKGAGTLAYGGDAIGGIVILEPANIRLTDSLFGKTILGFQSNGLGYNVTSSLNKITESGWYVNGLFTYKQNGDLKAPDYNLTNTGAKSFSGVLQGGFKSFEKGFEVYANIIDNEIGILAASHIGNVGDLVEAINSGEPLIIEDFSYDINAPKQEVNHKLLKASGFLRFKSLGKLTAQYDYQSNQRFEFDRRVGDDRDVPAVDLKLQTHSIKTDLTIDKFDNTKLNFGVIGRYQDNFANPDTGIRRLIPDYDKYDFGAFAIGEFELNENLKVDAGMRYDYNHIDAKKFYLTSRWEERGYDEDFSDIIIEDLGTQLLTNPVFDFHNVSLSAGVTYSINDENKIAFNYGLTSRPPNPAELFSDGLHHSAARIELGDLRLDKETANRFAINYQLNSSSIAISAETYLNSINNFIYLEPTGTESTIRGAFPVWEYLQTDALLMGADVNFSFNMNKHWIFDNTTSYVYGNDTDQDRPLIDIPAFRTTNSITYKNEDWLNFSITLQHQLVAMQNRYPDNNFETYIPPTDSFVLVDISTPPDGYQLFDLRTKIDLELSKKVGLNISAGIENLFDTNYREYLNRLRYFADDAGRNIFLQLIINY